MAKTASAKHISEAGNYGDQREYYASKYLLEHALPNDPEACLKALEDFDVRWTMLHLGREKGEHLDRAVVDAIRCRSCNWTGNGHQRPIRALEVGAYIGYSAIRIGRILAECAPEGSHLLSVEQNGDNACYAARHVKHAGLAGTVAVRHGRIEECFGHHDNNDDDDNINDSDHSDSSSSSSSELGVAPFDLVFLDHRKPFYLRDLKLLRAARVVDPNTTTVIADNVAPREHLRNRAEAVARGKRRGPCVCSNKACDFLEHVRREWSSTEICYGANSKDGISVSVPRVVG